VGAAVFGATGLMDYRRFSQKRLATNLDSI
jgi:hypothetical protein